MVFEPLHGTWLGATYFPSWEASAASLATSNTLPGGFASHEPVYYTAHTQTLPSGEKVTYGALGEVVLDDAALAVILDAAAHTDSLGVALGRVKEHLEPLLCEGLGLDVHEEGEEVHSHLQQRGRQLRPVRAVLCARFSYASKAF